MDITVIRKELKRYQTTLEEDIKQGFTLFSPNKKLAEVELALHIIDDENYDSDDVKIALLYHWHKSRDWWVSGLDTLYFEKAYHMLPESSKTIPHKSKEEFQQKIIDIQKRPPAEDKHRTQFVKRYLVKIHTGTNTWRQRLTHQLKSWFTTLIGKQSAHSETQAADTPPTQRFFQDQATRLTTTLDAWIAHKSYSDLPALNKNSADEPVKSDHKHTEEKQSHHSQPKNKPENILETKDKIISATTDIFRVTSLLKKQAFEAIELIKHQSFSNIMDDNKKPGQKASKTTIRLLNQEWKSPDKIQQNWKKKGAGFTISGLIKMDQNVCKKHKHKHKYQSTIELIYIYLNTILDQCTLIEEMTQTIESASTQRATIRLKIMVLNEQLVLLNHFLHLKTKQTPFAHDQGPLATYEHDMLGVSRDQDIANKTKKIHKYIVGNEQSSVPALREAYQTRLLVQLRINFSVFLDCRYDYYQREETLFFHEKDHNIIKKRGGDHFFDKLSPSADGKDYVRSKQPITQYTLFLLADYFEQQQLINQYKKQRESIQELSFTPLSDVDDEIILEREREIQILNENSKTVSQLFSIYKQELNNQNPDVKQINKKTTSAAASTARGLQHLLLHAEELGYSLDDLPVETTEAQRLAAIDEGKTSLFSQASSLFHKTFSAKKSAQERAEEIREQTFNATSTGTQHA